MLVSACMTQVESLNLNWAEHCLSCQPVSEHNRRGCTLCVKLVFVNHDWKVAAVIDLKVSRKIGQ